MANLTLEQKDAVRGVVKSIKNDVQVTTFSGFAGTGKTTCLNVIAAAFPNFTICAYTGKAANVLRKKGMDASTIHSLIYKPMMNERGGVDFFLKEPAEATWDGFLVDEASMVSKEIYEDLLTFGLPIVFVGDHGQLEPVGSNINVMIDPMYRLETVHRNAGEIAHFAEHIRKGRVARTFSADQKVTFVEPTAVDDEILLNAGQMICAYNRTRVEKNAHVRELLGYKKVIEMDERVMCLRNNKGRGLFNGMQGLITKVHPKHAKFDFWSDGVTYVDILYDPRQFGQEKNQFEFGKDSPEPFDYAYCITCHKCVKEDTYLFTEKGMVQIRDLWFREGRLQNINVDVVNFSGVNKATQIFRGNIERSYKIKDSTGRIITGSYRHPLLVWNKNCETEWKTCDKIMPGDILVSKLGSKLFSKDSVSISYLPSVRTLKRYVTEISVPPFISADHGLFLGYLVGDGSYNNERTIEITSQDDEILSNCLTILSNFGITTKIYKTKSKARRISLESLQFREFLMVCGLNMTKAHDKEVPSCILKSPREVQASFLRGLFDTDGSVDKAGRVRLVSVSNNLMTQVQLLLWNIGIKSDVKFNKNKYKGFYVLSICGLHVNVFEQAVGFGLSYKREKLANRIPSCGKTNVDFIPYIGKLLLELGCSIRDSLGNTKGKKGAGFYNNLSNQSKAIWRRIKLKPNNMSYTNLGIFLEDICAIWPHYVETEAFMRLEKIFLEKLQYTKVISVEEEYCQVYDISVPGPENFATNGFISKNSQGDEWDDVLVFEQQCSKWDHKRWAYTAASRAKESLIWVCPKTFLPSWL